LYHNQLKCYPNIHKLITTSTITHIATEAKLLRKTKHKTRPIFIVALVFVVVRRTNTYCIQEEEEEEEEENRS
jgi:Na+/H+ antiporter NhaC